MSALIPEVYEAKGTMAAKRGTSLLIHAINFAPEIIGCGKYTTELAHYLSSCGHKVEVITAPPHYPGWLVQPPYRALAYTNEVTNNIKVQRCPILMKPNAEGLWRLVAPLSFSLAAAPVVIWRILIERPKVLLCVEPTLFCTPFAVVMAKLVGTRCVLHVQDLEVDAAFAIKHIRGAAFQRLATAIESKILKRFDRIITISNKMRERLISKDLDPSKVVVVRNWVDTKKIKPVPKGRPNKFRSALGIEPNSFVVLYAGHIGPKQALDVVIAAARRLRVHKDIHFVIAGNGPERDKLRNQSVELTNISYLPLQPVDYLNELLAMADLHVLPQHRGAADLVLPSKLGGMLASGRPIVATVDPATELFEMLSNVSLVTPAGDELALSETIYRAKTTDLSGLVAKGLELAASLQAEAILPSLEGELFGYNTKNSLTGSQKPKAVNAPS